MHDSTYSFSDSIVPVIVKEVLDDKLVVLDDYCGCVIMANTNGGLRQRDDDDVDLNFLN